MATTAPSQALPMRITVLTGPFATRPLIAGQNNGIIELTGRALPYRPIIYEGRQRVKTTWYAGNTVATQQVMGAVEEPTIINGMWKDKYLGDGQARELTFLFDAVRRSGALVRVEWGAGFLNNAIVGKAIERVGIIKRTKFTFDRPQDVAWEVEFEWNGQGEAVAPALLASSVVNPREGITQAKNALQNATDAILNWSSQLQAQVSKLDQRVQAQINQLVTLTDSLGEATDTVSGTITAIPSTSRAGAERILNITFSMERSVRIIYDTLQGDDLLTLIGDDAVVELKFLASRLAMLVTLKESEETTATTGSSMEGQLFPEPIAEVRLPAGTSLRDPAQKYYGDPDLWFIIASANNITGTTVPSYFDGPSDNPGFPLIIPRRLNGDLGDVRKAGC